MLECQIQPLFAHTSMTEQRQHLVSVLVLVIDNLGKVDTLQHS